MKIRRENSKDWLDCWKNILYIFFIYFATFLHYYFTNQKIAWLLKQCRNGIPIIGAKQSDFLVWFSTWKWTYRFFTETNFLKLGNRCFILFTIKYWIVLKWAFWILITGSTTTERSKEKYFNLCHGAQANTFEINWWKFFWKLFEKI